MTQNRLRNFDNYNVTVDGVVYNVVKSHKHYKVEAKPKHATDDAYMQVGMVAEDEKCQGDDRFYSVQTNTPWNELTYTEYTQTVLPTTRTLHESVDCIVSMCHNAQSRRT